VIGLPTSGRAPAEDSRSRSVADSSK